MHANAGRGRNSLQIHLAAVSYCGAPIPNHAVQGRTQMTMNSWPSAQCPWSRSLSPPASVLIILASTVSVSFLGYLLSESGPKLHTPASGSSIPGWRCRPSSLSRRCRCDSSTLKSCSSPLTLKSRNPPFLVASSQLCFSVLSLPIQMPPFHLAVHT